MKKQSKYGGAPKRSQRSKLRDKGYEEFRIDGNSVFSSEKRAKSFVDTLHAKGYFAQALRIRSMDEGEWWIVMSKKKVKVYG